MTPRQDRAVGQKIQAWPWLLAAGLTETAWIEGVAHATGPIGVAATAAAVLASIACALRATRIWSATTVYIVFVALGTLGAATWRLVQTQAIPAFWPTVWMLVLLAGVAGLQGVGRR